MSALARAWVSVDRGRCTGAATCVSISPDIFDQDQDDGLVLIKLSDISADRLAAARESVAACPTGTIMLHED